jgi:hypothetical protein
MSPRHKMPKDSDFYESYEEFMIDYARCMKDEDMRGEETIRQNKRDVEYLRRKFASE